MASFRNSKIEIGRLNDLGLNVWVAIYWDKNNKKQQQPFICPYFLGNSEALERAKSIFSWSKFEGIYLVTDEDEETRDADYDQLSHMFFSVNDQAGQRAVNVQLYGIRGDVDIQEELLRDSGLRIVQQKRVYL